MRVWYKNHLNRLRDDFDKIKKKNFAMIMFIYQIKTKQWHGKNRIELKFCTANKTI